MAKGKRRSPSEDRVDVLQGTLDLMVLRTLASMGPLHGYGIARRIEQVSENALKLNEGTVYASLVRLQQQRWISATWGVSENNRRAKFYAVTKSGRKRLLEETENWRRVSGIIEQLIRLTEGEPSR
ncbi:MAG TPA: PadR family transcriptional regulator [Vicinamibacteria bacterium]|nr:PadR family transcriptional regulator [Vicinamibacteria bacterium]